MDWKQIESITKPPQKRPSDVFTSNEYATRFGLTLSAARNKLRELSKKGRLESVTFLEHSRHFTGYRIKGGQNVDK